MAWLQICFSALGSDAEALALALESCGAISVSQEHVGDDTWVETDWDEKPVWRESRVIGLFSTDTDPKQLVAALRESFHLDPVPPQVRTLEDRDWVDLWKANYQPLQVNTRLWIIPSWMAPPDPRAVNVILDPGMAFGTGDHPTTALCLAWLAEQDLADKDIVDYGSGSGILSIAALAMGARSAMGVEIDPQAIRVSRENAQQNNVLDRFRALAPEEVPVDYRADIVIANILARPLKELSSPLRRLVRAGGKLALSGMLAEQADEVAATYAMEFALSRRERGNWILLAGSRPGE